MGEQLPYRGSERTVGGGRARRVVVRPAELEVASVPANRPGRVRLAVPRRADAAGIDEKGSVRPWPLELEMAVPEDDRPVVLANALDLSLRRQVEKPLLLLRRQLVLEVDVSLHHLRAILRWFEQPPLAVATDPGRV